MADDKKRIIISTDGNRYNKDYNELPDHCEVKYGKDWDMVCSKEEFFQFLNSNTPCQYRMHQQLSD